MLSAGIAQIIFQFVIDVFAHGMKLPTARAAGDHKIIEYAGQLTKVQDHNVLSPIFRGSLSRGKR